MKSAKEWLTEDMNMIGLTIDQMEDAWVIEPENCEQKVQLFKQIQLDAIKEGMRRATNVSIPYNIIKGLDTEQQYHWDNGYTVALVATQKAILTTAEQLTEGDL